MTYICGVLLLCLSPFGVLAFENGAGLEACITLIPMHNVTEQPRSDLPYAVDVDVDKLETGKSIKVTLKMSADNEPYFEGFLVQARCISCSDPHGTIIPGTFTPLNTSAKVMSCGSKDNSITHTSHEHLTGVSFTWKPPEDLNQVEGVQFRATIVRNTDRFWSNIRSKELKGTSTGKTCGASTLVPGVIALVLASMAAYLHAYQ